MNENKFNRHDCPLNSENYHLPDVFIEKYFQAGLPEHAAAYQKVVELSTLIKNFGGQALLVGGCVRDFYLGKIAKDFDLEVHGLEPKLVENLVQKIGKVSEVGRSFGILKVSLGNGLDIDVSLPRTDSKIGEGHRGFEVKIDYKMSIKEAARRRDFTMNTLAVDPLTGKLYDYFNGLEDIKNRCLRVTDEERFQDDPLRVLRALQFVSRFGLMIDPDSLTVIRKMVSKVKELPKERILEEWKKLLLKSEQPSLGLSAGMILGVFHELHPEFVAMTETPQEVAWHPEGNAWNHTLLSVDQAAKLVRREELRADQALVIMLATLCHDLGKPAVTKEMEGKIKSHGHEKAGEVPTKKFLSSIGVPGAIRDKVVKLVSNHMLPTLFYISFLKNKEVNNGAIRRLANRIYPATISELVLVSESDHLGRGFFSPEKRAQLLLAPDSFLPGPYLLERARKLGVEKSRPTSLTRGRDWLGLGFPAGKIIGQLIKLSDRCRDELGLSREQVLAMVYDCELLSSTNRKGELLRYRNPEQALEILEKALEKKAPRHFTYFNYLKNREVIFECDAKGILEADELYKKATGKDPAKQSDVGCTVGKIIEHNS